jgi:hypothetical protein
MFIIGLVIKILPVETEKEREIYEKQCSNIFIENLAAQLWCKKIHCGKKLPHALEYPLYRNQFIEKCRIFVT